MIALENDEFRVERSAQVGEKGAGGPVHSMTPLESLKAVAHGNLRLAGTMLVLHAD
jgi:hypothetical protein